jgi:hypothetical protein
MPMHRSNAPTGAYARSGHVRRIFAPIAALAAVAITVGGCGSATNDYRGKVRDIQSKYEKQLTDLTGKATADMTANPSAATADLGQLSVVVTKFADEVAAVAPPADKKALADQLVAAYRELATASTDLKKAVETKDQTALATAIEEFNKATTMESTAIDAFNAAG